MRKMVIEFSIISACMSQQESSIIGKGKFLEIKFSAFEYKKEFMKIVHLNLHVRIRVFVETCLLNIYKISMNSNKYIH